MTAQRPSRSWWWELSPAASMSWNDIMPVTTFALCFLYLIINIGRGRRDLDLSMSLASPLLCLTGGGVNLANFLKMLPFQTFLFKISENSF